MFTTKGYGLSKTSGAIQFIVPDNKTINFKNNHTIIIYQQNWY